MPEVHRNGFGDESKLNDARMLAASFSKGKSRKEATSFKEDNDRNGEESRRQEHQLSVVQRGRSTNNSDRPWRQCDGGHSQSAESHAEPIVVPIEMTARRPRWQPQERQFSHDVRFYMPNEARKCATDNATLNNTDMQSWTRDRHHEGRASPS